MISQLFRPNSVGQPASARSATPRLRTVPRSIEYLRLVRRLDASAHVVDVNTQDVRERIDGELGAVDVAEVRDRLEHEFTATNALVPLGLIAHCYLGRSYEVHTLSWAYDVITHYHKGEPLPDGLERARRWARSTAYVAVEVYRDHVLCVLEDGSVVKAGT